MILLVDWGNTFLKAMLVASLNKESIHKATSVRLESLQQLKDYCDKLTLNQVLISSVRCKDDNEQLWSILSAYCEDVVFAKTSSEACGVICAYDEPQLLGIDRWLGVIAAASYASQVVVISVGSAVTFDVILNQKHLGGHIIPGWDLLHASLQKTGQVRAEHRELTNQFYQLGQSTTDCVHAGIHYLLRTYLDGLVNDINQFIQPYISQQSMQKEKRTLQEEPYWVFTGGGAEYWVNHLDTPKLNYHAKLVFEGLAKRFTEIC